MAFEIGLPKRFQVTNDYDSHRPMLYLATLLVPRGTVVELGCGDGSTMSLNWACRDRKFISFETDEWWAEKIADWILVIDDYSSAMAIAEMEEKIGILFVDSKPGEQRKELLLQWKDKADVIIIHDTEEGAEYVYGMKEALSGFRYRVDMDITGHPRTSAVSQTVDLNYWKQYNVGDHKIT